MKKLFLVVPIVALLAVGCNLSQQTPPPIIAVSTPSTSSPIQTPQTPVVTIKRGIYGMVTIASGNCMPGPGGWPSTCIPKGISTKIYIQEPETARNFEIDLKHSTKLVKEITSTETGFYEASLPAGTYSIFVDDNGKKYCNSIVGLGKVCQVTVGAGITEYNIRIDHTIN